MAAADPGDLRPAQEDVGSEARVPVASILLGVFILAVLGLFLVLGLRARH